MTTTATFCGVTLPRFLSLLGWTVTIRDMDTGIHGLGNIS